MPSRYVELGELLPQFIVECQQAARRLSAIDRSQVAFELAAETTKPAAAIG